MKEKGDTSMKKHLMFALVCLLSVVLLSNQAFAQTKDVAPACPKDKISVGTGITGGTYSNMIKPLLNLPGATDLICEYQKTGGGYDNTLLLMDRKIDAGLIQADVFDFLYKTNPEIRNKLRCLLSMHGSAMHIFVLKNGSMMKREVPGKVYGTNIEEVPVKIETLRDLKGLKVAAFSSAYITGPIVSNILKLDIDFVEVTKKNDGFDMLKRGEVVAFMAMGGKPIEWIEEVDSQVFTLANTETSDIQALGAPYYNTKLQYKKLNAVGTNAITARNDFVVWNYAGKKAEMLLQIRDMVLNNLADIKEDMDAHPAWQEITEENIFNVFWQKYDPPVKTTSKK